MLLQWKQGMAGIGRAACAMGVFDGLHIGHRFLLDAAISDARAQGVQAWAVTFDPDPDELFKPADSVAKLATNTQRLECLEQSGVDGVLVVPFDADVAALSPEDFLANILVSTMEPVSLHVGEDFRFGSHAAGSVSDLRAWGDRSGCAIHAHSLLCSSELPVTATRIRALLAAGEVAAAAELLAHPYKVAGTVVEGRHLGTALGFPTANLAVDPSLAKVADGVYAAALTTSAGLRVAAAVSVGVPATFGDLPSTIEAFLLDTPPEAAPPYGSPVTLEYLQYLRPMQAFPNPKALQAAIAKNVEQTREVFASQAP